MTWLSAIVVEPVLVNLNQGSGLGGGRAGGAGAVLEVDRLGGAGRGGPDLDDEGEGEG